MPLMQVIDQQGVEHEVESQSDINVMEVLRELDYGVSAICGGTCSCATCHVYIDSDWLEKLPNPDSEEQELLSTLLYSKPQSRLSCQINFTVELAGMKLTIAPDE